MNLHEIRKRLEVIAERMTEMADAAADEQRDYTPTETKEWDELRGEFARLEEQRERLEKLEKLARNPNARAAVCPPDDTLTVAGRNETRFNYNRGLAAWDGVDARMAFAKPEDAMRTVERCIAIEPTASDAAKRNALALFEKLKPHQVSRVAGYIAAVSNPRYGEAFAAVWADPTHGPQALTADQARAVQTVTEARTAMAIGTGATGGYAVPFSLDSSIVLTNAGATSPIRRIARTEQIVTDSWNGVSSAGSSATFKAEATEATDDSPTLAQPSVPVHRYDAFVPFSLEVGMDWPNFAAEIVGVMGDAEDRLLAEKFITGTGSDEPTGIITALGSGADVDPATAETFTLPDVYATAAATNERAWESERFAFLSTRGTQFAIRQLTDNVEAVWVDVGGGNPPLLLGKPSHTASAMDDADAIDAGATANNRVLLAGDFAKYVVAVRLGQTIELVPHLFGANNRPTGQRGYFMFGRIGADSIDDSAFAVLNVATTA